MNRKFSFFWGAGLIFVPLFLRLNEMSIDARYSKQLAFLLFSFLALVFFKQQKKISSVYKVGIAYVIGHLFYFSYSFINIHYFMQFIFTSMGFVLFLKLSESSIDVDLILNFIVATCMVQVGWSLCSYYVIDPYVPMFKILGMDIIFQERASLFTGSFGSSMTYGCFLAICLPAMFRNGFKKFIPLTVFCIIMTKGLMPILSALSGVLYFFYTKRFNNKLFPYIAFSLIGLFFIIFGFPYGIDTYRHEAWKSFLSLMDFKDFIFGKGLGFIPDKLHGVITPNGKPFSEAHNEFIELLVAGGILVFIPVIYLLIKKIKEINNPIVLSGIFATIVSCYGNFTFHITASALIAITYLGMESNNVKAMER